MRKLYKLAIGVIVLFTLFFLLCYEHYSVPEGVKGTIFVIGHDAYAYNPSKDIRTEIPELGKHLQPTFQCKLALDSFIVSSLNPLDSSKGLFGFYKVTPFGNTVTRIVKLRERRYLKQSLDYNEQLDLFLFNGQLNSDEDGLYILDTGFNIIEDISFIVNSLERPSSVENYYLIDSTTILFNHFYQEVRLYSLKDSSSKIIANGSLEAISHDRTKVVLLIGHSQQQINLLVDLKGGPDVKLPPINSAGFCFSPDDSYIACMHGTNDLSNTFELHIYERSSDKMYKTRITGRGGLVWVNKEN